MRPTFKWCKITNVLWTISANNHIWKPVFCLWRPFWRVPVALSLHYVSLVIFIPTSLTLLRIIICRMGKSITGKRTTEIFSVALKFNLFLILPHLATLSLPPWSSSPYTPSFPLIFTGMDTLPVAQHFVVCVASQPVGESTWRKMLLNLGGFFCLNCVCDSEDDTESVGAFKT